MAAKLLSHDLRLKFIDFFANKHGHKYFKSSSIKQPDNSELSFTVAGMNQFKERITRSESFDDNLKRACSYQKCIRVGGKKCDLNQVGRNFRHHTFFEMLGNWSFNNYGKQEACEWALDFLVNHLHLKQENLSVTHFSSPTYLDTETEVIWRKLGFESSQILANSQGDNFWESDSNGPCGVSTEIFYSNDGSLAEEKLELWNLVFMDKRKVDGNKIVPLNGLFVDTGLGLERVLSVLENVPSNYDTDLFKPLIEAIEKKSPDVDKYSHSLSKELDVNYRLLSDHCRMIAVALTDGVVPGRRGDAFEVRRIIKRACLASRDVFKQETPRYLLFDVIDAAVASLEPAYPELRQSVKMIRSTLASETKRYLNYLNKEKQDDIEDDD